MRVGTGLLPVEPRVGVDRGSAAPGQGGSREMAGAGDGSGLGEELTDCGVRLWGGEGSAARMPSTWLSRDGPTGVFPAL